MQDRLFRVAHLRGQFTCTTVDRFAWRIFRRWRSLAVRRGYTEVGEDDYETVSEYAGRLLSESLVREWVTRTFPVVVVDEMQDSKDGQLAIIQNLTRSAMCLTAADEYQDLDASGPNMAVRWAHQMGTVVSLTSNHRTSAPGLLTAASALRDGQKVPLKGKGFKILGAFNANVGASHVSQTLTWWRARESVAVITPVRAETSRFVRELARRVEEGPFERTGAGPHPLRWESSQGEDVQEILTALRLPEDESLPVQMSEALSSLDDSGIYKAVRSWIDRERRLTGRTIFTQSEVRHEIRRIHQRTRAYRRAREQGVRLTTVHQAKNREFESVIVLWPYETVGSRDRKRRVLYNAITRARREALVVVQNPKRCYEPPFVP